MSAAIEIQPVDLSRTGDLRMRLDTQGHTIELLADGRLRAARERSLDLVRHRLNPAEIIPTGPSWILLRPVKPPTETAPTADSARMAGAVDNAGLGLLDILGFLSGGMQTGVLEVTDSSVRRAVYLSRGEIVWAESTASTEKIGEFLVERGKISETDLADLLGEDPTAPGLLAAQRGLVTEAELATLVQSLLQEICERLTIMEQGLWTFSGIADDVLARSTLRLSTQHVLMDACRKVDELRLYRKVIRSPDEFLELVEDQPQKPMPKELTAEAKALVDNIEGLETIRSLMRKTSRSEYEVTRLVYHLHGAKMLRIRSKTSIAPTKPTNQVAEGEAREIVRIYAMAIREIFGEAKENHQHNALYARAADFLAEERPDRPNLLRAVRLTVEGDIDDRALILAVQATAGIDQLNDGLDELLFFLLFQAGELLGPKRRDDLARRIKMMQRMLGTHSDSSYSP